MKIHYISLSISQRSDLKLHITSGLRTITHFD